MDILVNADVTHAIAENVDLKVKKLKKLLGMWSQRNLSLKGKVTFLKTFAIPQILYVASVLPVPHWIVQEVDKLLFSFLWSYKKPYVRKEVIISPIEYGGLKMPHFSSIIKGIKCTWISRLLKADLCKQEMLKTFISYKGKSIPDIIRCKLKTEFIDFLNVTSTKRYLRTGMKYTVKLQTTMF